MRPEPGCSMRFHMPADGFDDFHRAHLAEHQQARGNASQELRNCIESLPFAGLGHSERNRVLDAREVDDALAHHRLGHLAVIGLVADLDLAVFDLLGGAPGMIRRTS